MGRLLALLIFAACADLGPERARIESLMVYACTGDPCTLGPQLSRPPNDGTWFYLRATAPGALLMQYSMYWPSTLTNGEGFLESDPVKADTLGAWWSITVPFTQLKWRVSLPWTGDRILDADSLVWVWP